MVKKKKNPKNSTPKATNLFPSKEENTQNENFPNVENKLSIDENKTIINIDNLANDPLGKSNDTNIYSGKDLKNVYINNWLICCFWCSNRKKNVNKALFEEGSRMITERLDILNIFNNLYVSEIMQKKFGIEAQGMNMSDICINNLQT